MGLREAGAVARLPLHFMYAILTCRSTKFHSSARGRNAVTAVYSRPWHSRLARFDWIGDDDSVGVLSRHQCDTLPWFCKEGVANELGAGNGHRARFADGVDDDSFVISIFCLLALGLHGRLALIFFEQGRD
ncbi:hypothetical protein ZWY2020_038356 [Hordeum vulgare]|nr:hypothetical protein ZWY2020_038356 [Hordeum vulgare]